MLTKDDVATLKRYVYYYANGGTEPTSPAQVDTLYAIIDKVAAKPSHWEEISEERLGVLTLITRRQAVPGGWLYMLTSRDALYPESVTFVPTLERVT